MSVLLWLLPITVTPSSEGFLSAVFAGAVSSCCCPGKAGSGSRAGPLDRLCTGRDVWRGLGPISSHCYPPLHLAPPRFALSLITALSLHSPQQGPSWMREGASGWWVALNVPFCVLALNPGQDWTVHPRTVSAFLRGSGLCSGSSGLVWASLVPSANRLLLSQLFPPFPCCWLEELPLTLLILIPWKTWLETDPIIHPVLFLPVSKTHGKGGKEKFNTKSSFPLWWLQCTSLKTRAHRGVKPFCPVTHHKWLLSPSPLSLWGKPRCLHPGEGSSPTCWLCSSLAMAEAHLADTALCLAPGPLHPLLVCWGWWQPLTVTVTPQRWHHLDAGFLRK